MKTITETLLIADDEKNIRDGLKYILDRSEEHTSELQSPA